MPRFLILILLTLLFLPLRGQTLVPVGTGYSATSVNAAIFRTNSVATHEGLQYVAYYDSTGTVTLARRDLRRGTSFETHRTQYSGNVRDGHNVISIMVDGAGYLHVAFDHHGHPLHYARSVAPGSLELGDLQPMVGRGEERVTYPEFYRLSTGDLLFLYRTGASGNGDLVLNRYDVKTETWRRVQDNLIDGQGERNGYWQACVDGRDRLHLSWVWRETWKVETNHDLCYAYSPDGGETWRRSDGSACPVPMTVDNAEYIARIPQRSELINQTSMTCDDAGRPYIVTYWRTAGDSVPQFRLIWLESGAWHQTQVARRVTPFSLSGGGTKRIPISRPKVVVRRRHRLLGHRTEVSVLFRDAEHADRVSLAQCSNLKPSDLNISDSSTSVSDISAVNDWTVSDLTDFSVGAWEPSFDTELWRREHRLHVYVQQVAQGDGERVTQLGAQPVWVLEVK
jgi:hypothetical protein